MRGGVRATCLRDHSTVDTPARHQVRHHYYDPGIGRWTQVDPSGLDAHYVYARNNPINFVDPSGHLSVGDVAGAISDAAGLVTPAVTVGCAAGFAVACPVAAGSAGVGILSGTVETAAECDHGDECGDAALGLGLNVISGGLAAYGKLSASLLVDFAGLAL